MFKKLFSIIGLVSLCANEPMVTAEKLISHWRSIGRYGEFTAPEVVLVCYQRKTMEYLLEKHPEFQHSDAVTHLYQNGRVGILGDWGVGAPGLSIKIECLIEHGTKKFIAVGTAGSLLEEHQIGDCVICPKALAEDGVAHLYLPNGERVAEADSGLIDEWLDFAKESTVPPLKPAMAWSFSAIFKETLADVRRVHRLGCSVVEMEAATLYAIAKEKGVQTFPLFVISDMLTEEEWKPHQRLPEVSDNLHRLADLVLEFSASFLPKEAEDKQACTDDKYGNPAAV